MESTPLNMKFKIDPKYLKDKVVVEPCELFYNGKWNRGTSRKTEEHSKFTEFRNMLSNKGYIEINESCWNCDKAIKSFSVNNVKFKRKETFPCAANLAIKIKLKQEQ
jgi:hypothetical protein